MCLLAILASACTGGEPGVERNPSEPLGGTLRLALVSTQFQLEDPRFLDPQRPHNTLSPQAALFRCCLVRTLLSYDPSEDGGTVLRPDLAAEAPQVSADGLTWTFRLKEGLRYAPPLDQVEITAPDLVRAIRRTALRSVSAGGYKTHYSVIQGYDELARGEADTISGLEVVDDHTLRVHLAETTNDFAYRMALPGSGPIPPSPHDPEAPLGLADGHDEGYGPYLVASGPYMLEGAQGLDPSAPPEDQRPAPGLKPGRSVTFVRNPSWDRATDDLRAAYVDRIELQVMDLDRAARRVDEGTADLIYDGDGPPEQVARYLSDPELVHRVFRGSAVYVGYSTMNLAVPPFDDVHVRRAVNLAYDEDTFTRIASARRWGEAGYFTFSSFGHLAPDATEASLLRGYDPYPFDPDAARREMARSGYDEDDDGICDDPVCRDVLALDTDFGPESVLEKEVWVEALQRIGITLDIRRIASITRFFRASLDPSSKVALNLGMFWFADYPSASTFFPGLFRAEGIGVFPFGNVSLVGATAAQLKRWGYDVTRVPNVNGKIDRCLSFIGFAQTRCWAELDQLIMTQVVPWVPQVVLDFVKVVSARVTKFAVDVAMGSFPALDHIALGAGAG
jgi:ABC-type transport system substrate-binding protein